MSVGLEYRPLLNNNVVMAAGMATLVPSKGFKDLYDRFNKDVMPPVAGFAQMTVLY